MIENDGPVVQSPHKGFGYLVTTYVPQALHRNLFTDLVRKRGGEGRRGPASRVQRV